MEMRRFRHYAGMRMPWIFAVGMGLYWFLLFVYPAMNGSEVSSDDEVTIRYVERELLFLEAGEGSGWFVSWWTGRSEEQETVGALQALLEGVWADGETAGLKAHLEKLENSGGGEVVDYFSEEEQRSLLWRSLFFGLIEGLVLVALPFLLWWGRRSWREEGRTWRLTRVWSPAWVLTVFFLALILVEGYWLGVMWTISGLAGGEHGAELIYSLLWRGLPGVLAAFALLGSWSGIRRVFLGTNGVAWANVLGAFGILTVFHYLVYSLANDPGVLDPGDYFWVADPTASEVIVDVFDGVVFAPVFEELMFRGVLFLGMMKRLGAPLAALISTVLFAVVHTQYDAWAMFSVGVFGLACCWLTWKTGSIKSGIVLHMIFNGLITLYAWAIYQMPVG